MQDFLRKYVLFLKTHETQKRRKRKKDNQTITKEHKIYVVHLYGLHPQSCSKFHYDGENNTRDFYNPETLIKLFNSQTLLYKT